MSFPQSSECIAFVQYMSGALDKIIHKNSANVGWGNHVFRVTQIGEIPVKCLGLFCFYWGGEW